LIDAVVEMKRRNCHSRKLDLRLLGPQDSLPIQHKHTERYCGGKR
jgi:hypothetical protein